MFVVVEGIDRVGKTTLCQMLERNGFITLKDAFGRVISNVGAQSRICTDNDEQFPMYSVGKIDTAIQYIKSLNDKGFNIVADRLHLTELVYGTVERPYVPRDDKIFKLDRMISEMFDRDAMLVLVTPTNIHDASKRAGKDLSSHSEMFLDAFISSSIRSKFSTDFLHLEDAVSRILKKTFKYDFYFASPFFRPDQIEREERLKAHLRGLGYSVFSPKESCHLQPDATQDSQEKVFNDNVTAIRKSAAVFAVTDGKDMGTIWEAGYAFGIGKPIIYYAETLGENLFNLMLARSGRAVCKSQEDVTKTLIEDVLIKGKGTSFDGRIE